MPIPGNVVRNARLLLQSAAQHLADDPALLVVQASRRLPFAARVRVGKAFRALPGRFPGGEGAAALGAVMAGDDAAALRLVTSGHGSRSRLLGEVAVLLDRPDLVAVDASPLTRARAAWVRGDLRGAIRILETGGRGQSRYARRLRSELRLLEPGYRLHSAPPESRDIRVKNDKATRVLHVLTNSLPHTQSGYSLRTHRILTALQERGIESVALTRTGYPVMIGLPLAADEDVVDGIRYVRTLPSRLPQTQEERLQAEVHRALELVSEFRPHVIHATTNYYNALVAQAVSAATGLPWVLEVRGLMEKTWIAAHASEAGKQEAAGSEKARMVALREAELAQQADGVVTLSQTMVEELTRRGVDRSAITVVPNGVDSSLLTDHLTPREARAELGIGLADDFVVGAVSALVDYEGLDLLLRAVSQVIRDESVPDSLRRRIRVVIAGDGTAAPGLRALAQQLMIAERVLMPGRIPRHAARTWVQALDAVVVPRRDVEVARLVTPQKPVEAMALARPVIIADLPALRETVTGQDGEVSATVFAPESPSDLAAAIVQLAQDPRATAARVESGLRAARARTWPSLVEKYEKLYADAVSHHQEEHSRG